MSDWTRMGECNECGDCCRHGTNPIELILPDADEAYGRVRFGDPVGTHNGQSLFRIRGPVLMPCPMLDGNRCSIHATKPQFCRDTPKIPEDIEGLTNCSFYFFNHTTGEVRTPMGSMLPIEGARS